MDMNILKRFTIKMAIHMVMKNMKPLGNQIRANHQMAKKVKKKVFSFIFGIRERALLTGVMEDYINIVYTMYIIFSYKGCIFL